MNILFSSPFDSLVEKATSENNVIGSDLSHLYFEISDAIKAKQVPAKNAISTIKKRLLHKNPNVVLLTLDLLDICIKNSGHHFLVQVASKDFVDTLATIGGSAEVRSKSLSYLQSWGLSFRENMSLCYMTTVYEAFKSQGTKFPPIDKSTIGSIMIDTTTAPEWSDSEYCVRCRTKFTTFNRKHHCRNCGCTFCNDCSSNKAALPHLGVTEEVRLCDGCFGKISSGTISVVKDSDSKATKSTLQESDDDEDLKKAIAASLEVVPKSEKVKKPKKKISFKDVPKTNAEKEEEELEAAIKASLLESKKEAPKEDKLPPYPKISPAELYTEPVQAPKKVAPAEVVQIAQTNELSKTEIENLHLFSELVERTDAQVALRGMHAFNPSQLQNTFATLMPIASKLQKNVEDLESKKKHYEDLNRRVTDAVVWYEQKLQQQLSQRAPKSFAAQSSYQPYQESGYNPTVPYSDHGFALPPTPVQPAYGEFYSNRIYELSHESHPQIYSAPPLESPSGGYEGVNIANVPSYAQESYGMPPSQYYAPQGPPGPNQGQDSFSQPMYAAQGYAPESGYAPYHPGQVPYPGQYESAPYQNVPSTGTVEAPPAQNVEEKPLIEF